MIRPADRRLRAPRTAVALLAAWALAAPLAPGRAGAQTSPAGAGAERRAEARRGSPAVRVAKWALLGVAAGFGVYALTHSDRADRAYGDLRALCSGEPGACELAGGRYLEARAEAFYRGSVREDRRAQLGILGGQLALLGSVALFVVDLRNDRGPDNIPYPAAGLQRGRAGRGIAVGAALRF